MCSGSAAAGGTWGLALWPRRPPSQPHAAFTFFCDLAGGRLGWGQWDQEPPLPQAVRVKVQNRMQRLRGLEPHSPF
jgi:hypothetical protein